MVDLRDRDAAVEMELANFINEFLFARGADATAHALSPRHQRTPRNKRYRGMWRFAARSLIKKGYASEEILPPGVDQLLLPRSPALPSTLPSKLLLDKTELGRSDGAQQQSSIRIDVVSMLPSFVDVKDAEKAASPVLQGTADLSCAMVGTDVQRGYYCRAEAFEATSTHAMLKHSCRKPPRPPRASMSHSSSYRAIRFKTAARRAMLENAKMKRRKMPTSTSNASSIWALIITLCFASIMLVQGFLGNNFKGTDPQAEGQLSFTLHENGLSLSPDTREIPPPTSKSSTQNSLSQHGAGLSFAYMDRVQQSEPRASRFMALQEKKSQATSKHAGFTV